MKALRFSIGLFLISLGLTAPAQAAEYEVLYASGAYTTDVQGKAVSTLLPQTKLDDERITVDVGGVLFLQKASGGYLQIFQNSSLLLQETKITLRVGELIVRDAPRLALATEKFEVVTDNGFGDIYLFSRANSTFVSLANSSRPARIRPVGGEPEISLESGSTALVSGSEKIKTHSLIPRGAAKVIAKLGPAIDYLRSDRKSQETLRVLHAQKAEIAVPTASGREFRSLIPGETLVLQPDFAPLTFRLEGPDSVMSVGTLEPDGSTKVHNFSGELMFSLSMDEKTTGSKS